MPDLLDASVWFSLSVADHTHHARSMRYWHTEAAEDLAFCRVTGLALLRLLSNPAVLRQRAVSSSEAWRALQAWLGTPQVTYVDEPRVLDEILGAWADILDSRAGHWTDAYLAAFAVASGSRLVSFDADFSRYPGLSWLHLQA